MLHTRLVQVLATAGLVIALGATQSAASVRPQATAAAAAKIKLSSTLAGQVLTDARGYVLFMFPKEGNSLTYCEKRKSCLTDWPPVTTTGKPVAGPGVDANLLGTEPYKGRLREVTYGGWPLHTYKFAYSVQSSVLNIGIKQFGGPWYALGPAGQFVK